MTLTTGEVLESYKTGVHKRNDALTKISSRQREVLQLLAEGNVAKEVAGILNISTWTVEFHKYKMMEALGIKSSAELVQFAVKHGIVSIHNYPKTLSSPVNISLKTSNFTSCYTHSVVVLFINIAVVVI